MERMDENRDKTTTRGDCMKCSECGTEDNVFKSLVLGKEICWNCREKILSEKDATYAKNVKAKQKFSLKRILKGWVKHDRH